MNLKLQEHVNLAGLTTMKIGGKAKYFTEVTKVNQLPEAFVWLKAQNLPHFVLGGGSNTIFDDGEFKGLVIKMGLLGFKVLEENDNSAIVWVAAGEDWDEIVARCVKLGLTGIESLSGIPGLAGTAPVQNIGAYGQEIKNVIKQVSVFDTQTKQEVMLSNADCGFDYRNSVFKSSQKGRYIITSIEMQLSKQPAKIPPYKDVIDYFKKAKNSSPDLHQVRAAVLEIRKHKFANPAEMPNAGSFFKNPIIPTKQADKLKAKFPEIRMFEQPDGTCKVFAGWLIEQAGLKGEQLHKVQVDPNHALVLENTGGASQKDLMELITKIQAEVNTIFGINLEPEPEIVRF